MPKASWSGIGLDGVETPCYVVSAAALRRNLAVLRRVQDEAQCSILLALKGFAMWSLFDTMRDALAGVAASSPHEAQLGAETFGKQVHATAPGYSEDDFKALLGTCDHIVLNSLSQWRRLRPLIPAGSNVEFGLRVNPEHREVDVALYDPCAPGSRLGITQAELAKATDEDLRGLTGLHFHTLCELGSDALERTLRAVEAKFPTLLERASWVNMGGGHHITRPDYDVELLIRLIKDFAAKHDVSVILEPGEAIALNTGVLVASVLDVIHNDVDIAILDVSATAHMPDVLEMPYRPRIVGGSEPDKRAHPVRLAGLTCLAGDVVGDYSFDMPLKVGDRLVFEDMAHYTMVKNTTFNGVKLPSIAVADDDEIRVVRRFGYQDYKGRLS